MPCSSGSSDDAHLHPTCVIRLNHKGESVIIKARV